MKSSQLLIAAVIGLCLSLSTFTFAADGAASYKAKCAMCHGAEPRARLVRL
jgi:cytochrome c553